MDNTSLSSLINRLKQDSNVEWFRNSHMQSNQDKYSLVVCENKYKQICAKIGKKIVWEAKSQKLMNITTDNSLMFDAHIGLFYKRVGRKLSALSHLCPYLSFKKHTYKTYCTLIWILDFTQKERQQSYKSLV